MFCGSTCKTFNSAAYEPNILTGHADGSIRMYSSYNKSKQSVWQIDQVFSDEITNILPSSDTNYIYVASKYGLELRTIDTRMKKILKTITDPEYFNAHEYNKLCFGKNEKYVIGGS